MRYLKETKDRAQLLSLAETYGPVRVLRTPAVVRTTSGPYEALRLQYWIDVPDAGGGTTWTYSEIALADRNGNVDLSRSVLAELESKKNSVVFSHRSGSL